MKPAKTTMMLLLTCWTLLSAMAQAQVNLAHNTLKPTYWQHHQFFIPYQNTRQGKLVNPIAKVELLISRTGQNDWTTLEEAKPNVQGFSYQAPGDGEYWFALRHLDRRGQPWPSGEVSPKMRMVIDTQQPQLALEALLDTNGEAVIRYEAQDINLLIDTLLLEIRTNGNTWTAIHLGEPDLAQEKRLVGRARWQPPRGAETVEVRAVIADRAGHRAKATTSLKMPEVRPQVFGPALGSPDARGEEPTSNKLGGPSTVKNPFIPTTSKQPAQLPSHDWPATNQLPAVGQTARSIHSPPPANPYTVASQTHTRRTPAKLIGDHPHDRNSQSRDGFDSLPITPLADAAAPLLMPSRPTNSTAADASSGQDLWSSVDQTNHSASRVVNSRTFDIEYDLQSVGPWGVAKVELWGTADNGQSWRSFGVDPDNRSPIRVTVPDAGTYGFRILVDGANSAGSTPPQIGDEPELTISVDLQPPAAELRGTQLGSGNLSDHLLIRWTAQDTNLESRPIALFYSSYPNGPWSTIASGLENTGSYTWRIERHVPGRFYLRLEARDVAGNIATYQSPSPTSLARPKPTGRLKGVRAITSDQ